MQFKLVLSAVSLFLCARAQDVSVSCESFPTTTVMPTAPYSTTENSAMYNKSPIIAKIEYYEGTVYVTNCDSESSMVPEAAATKTEGYF